MATDDPGLHLVWRPDKLFVQQIPEYLLRHPRVCETLSSPISISTGASVSWKENGGQQGRPGRIFRRLVVPDNS